MAVMSYAQAAALALAEAMRADANVVAPSGPAIDMGLTFEYNGNPVGPLSLNPSTATSLQLSLWSVQ